MGHAGKRIVLAFDGTWNNPYLPKTREDGLEVLKPSNPLKIARSILPWDAAGQMSQIVYYETGVGALGDYPGLANKVLGTVDKHFGGALGAGFEASVEQAVTFLVNNYIAGDAVFVFGFSRGAAQARALTHFLDWMGGLPRQSDAYYIPRFFREYLRMKGTGSPSSSQNKDVRHFKGDLRKIEISFLGVFDTVMSLNARFRADDPIRDGSRSFHVKDRPAACVKHARQALAIDEERFDFQPEIWAGCAQSQTLEQRWFCGVHANIGGGYVNDGLANQSFQWMIEEAETAGLEFDRTFTAKYRAFAQDRLYNSRTKIYRITEALRFAQGKGNRALTGWPLSANLGLDTSVITRLHANSGDDPAKYDRMTRYRPQNLLALLREHRDTLAAYIEQTGAKQRDPILPQDILDELRSP